MLPPMSMESWLMWRWHQLISGSLPNGRLSRVSRRLYARLKLFTLLSYKGKSKDRVFEHPNTSASGQWLQVCYPRMVLRITMSFPCSLNELANLNKDIFTLTPWHYTHEGLSPSSSENFLTSSVTVIINYLLTLETWVEGKNSFMLVPSAPIRVPSQWNCP